MHIHTRAHTRTHTLNVLFPEWDDVASRTILKVSYSETVGHSGGLAYRLRLRKKLLPYVIEQWQAVVSFSPGNHWVSVSLMNQLLSLNRSLFLNKCFFHRTNLPRFPVGCDTWANVRGTSRIHENTAKCMSIHLPQHRGPFSILFLLQSFYGCFAFF